MVALLDIIL